MSRTTSGNPKRGRLGTSRLTIRPSTLDLTSAPASVLRRGPPPAASGNPNPASVAAASVPASAAPSPLTNAFTLSPSVIAAIQKSLASAAHPTTGLPEALQAGLAGPMASQGFAVGGSNSGGVAQGSAPGGATQGSSSPGGNSASFADLASGSSSDGDAKPSAGRKNRTAQRLKEMHTTINGMTAANSRSVNRLSSAKALVRGVCDQVPALKPHFTPVMVELDTVLTQLRAWESTLPALNRERKEIANGVTNSHTSSNKASGYQEVVSTFVALVSDIGASYTGIPPPDFREKLYVHLRGAFPIPDSHNKRAFQLLFPVDDDDSVKNYHVLENKWSTELHSTHDENHTRDVFAKAGGTLVSTLSGDTKDSLRTELDAFLERIRRVYYQGEGANISALKAAHLLKLMAHQETQIPGSKLGDGL